MSLMNDGLKYKYDVCVACGCEDLLKYSSALGPRRQDWERGLNGQLPTCR